MMEAYVKKANLDIVKSKVILVYSKLLKLNKIKVIIDQNFFGNRISCLCHEHVEKVVS